MNQQNLKRNSKSMEFIFNHAGESEELNVKEEKISGREGLVNIITDRPSRIKHNSCGPRQLLNECSECFSLGK